MFVVVYIPTALVVGWWHRRTQMRVESDIGFQANREQVRLFRLILERQIGEATDQDIRDVIAQLKRIERDGQADGQMDRQQ